ncbi:MAG: CHASE2 domain-containing protein [Nitrospirae bacterium]|nr:MAG: CHASE2 domain-containing protein [Nitrospirota bacterium]
MAGRIRADKEMIKNIERKAAVFFKVHLRTGLVIGCALSVLLSLTIYLRAFEALEFNLLNKAFLKKNAPAQNQEIVTLDIDDPSLAYVGRWPWSWNIHAMTLDFLSMHGARSTVLVDMDFSREEPERLSNDSAVQLRKSLQASAGKRGPAASLMPDAGMNFYKSVEKSGNAVFSYALKQPLPGASAAEVKEAATQKEKLFLPDKVAAIEFLKKQSGIKGAPKEISAAIDMDPPVIRIMRSAKKTGFNAIDLDPDGFARRYPLFAEYQGTVYPSVALNVATDLLNAERTVFGKRHIELGGKTKVPVDSEGRMLINWAGAYADSFTHVPFNLLSSFIALQAAKEEASKHSLQDMPDPMALQEIILNRLSALHMLPDEQCKYISTVVFVSTLIEFYLRNTPNTIEEVLDSLGVDAKDEQWLALGKQIQVNNFLVGAYKKSKKVLPFGELLEKSRAGKISKNIEGQLKDAYAQAVFYLENGNIEKVRPLFFDGPKKLTLGKRVISVSPAFFKNKTVFYGLTATGLTAQHATPFLERHPMLDVVPNVVNTIVTGSFISEAPPWAKYAMSAFYLFGVLFLALVLSPFKGLLFASLAAVFHCSLSWSLFINQGYLLPVVPPLSAVVVSYGAALFYRYLQEQKEKRKVRGMFSTMVSPEVLRMMEENPAAFRLAGEQREATMFSSDVSGFTTISEGVTARELANILNIYLTPMSNIIMSYNGYIDKYEGDAIKAEFGVPLYDPDHSWKACFSALYQQEELKVIQRMIFLKYGVSITARMGVNTGIVTAGNMGSEKRMQYTVMGDAVTIAEELEPANKLFETWIAIGPATHAQAGEFIDTRYLNNLIMGHAHQSLPVYELTGWNKEKYIEYWSGKPVPELYLEAFKKMIPEKVIAYDDFFASKQLPDSKMLNDIKALFAGLRPRAVEYMTANNILSVLFVRQELEGLSASIRKNENLYSGIALPGLYANDISMLKEKSSAASEEWGRVLLGWRAQLRECAGLHFVLKEKISKDEADRYYGTIDILEKSVECINKRIVFPKPEDEIAIKMADHLKELVGDKDASLLSHKTSELSETGRRLEKEIHEKLTAFAEALRTRADEYHEFLSDFCVVSDRQKEAPSLYAQGHKHYLKREWNEARDLFKKVLAVLPDDGPSGKMLEKIEQLEKAALPRDWDGAWEE